jgi:hypothetical protein
MYTSYLLNPLDPAHETYVGWNRLAKNSYCVPVNVGQVQLRKVYIKYANDNPQDLHLTAASLATNAFYFAFPCEES